MTHTRDDIVATTFDEDSRPSVLIVIPTYNERDTLPHTLTLIRDHTVGWPRARVDILVVDDSSPDGTGEWVASLGGTLRDHSSSPGDDGLSDNTALTVKLLVRPAKSGLASAYLDGFSWARDHGYDFVVEMDADGSHRVVDVVRTIDRALDDDHPDVVIGSRWVNGGRTLGWSLPRVALSKAGNLYIRAMLAMRVRDATAGMRVYRTALFNDGILDEIESRGYGFQVEMTYRLDARGATIVEVPITFVERRAGASKMSWDIMVEELRHVTAWGIGRLLGR